MQVLAHGVDGGVQVMLCRLLRDGGLAKHLQRLGHAADFVLPVQIGDRALRVAPGQPGHAPGQSSIGVATLAAIRRDTSSTPPIIAMASTASSPVCLSRHSGCHPCKRPCRSARSMAQIRGHS
jgi:hypothetical protein